jgi:chemosensory pili system protein ChpA (sensor histidine kinase/response regulator)
MICSPLGRMSTRPSVLIVDDDLTIRKLISTILCRREIDFSTARDGIEALEKLDEGRYEVMLLDLMMPRMDGYEVLGRIRERADRPFVILVSAQGDYAAPGLDPTVVHAILRKPFDIEFLVDLILSTAAAAPPAAAGNSQAAPVLAPVA